ncbi:phosphoserine aminotransferase [Tetraselmis virus 1]|uniref:NifS-like protein n=1 Tax=Tetraselmis virus 1 TaxID=2060617 RepID=A0A2P0VN35_9VIRU|nr:phosphoserine aminotransferase [Tetraselmis virus 1]AUF82322.1 phosphoserine aminotransferase [Tetraselmis virus 1]
MIHNFSAGPSHVSLSALNTVARDLYNYDNTGMSFMEISHRDPKGPVQNEMVSAQRLIRRLLVVPETHHILFMQGGAHAQFSAVPLNLIGDDPDSYGAIIDTGEWSQKFASEASVICPIKTICFDRFRFPCEKEFEIPNDEKLKFVHVCANETITGIEMFSDLNLPENIVLVGDFTSTLMSRPIDVSKYGVIYASSGKNLGPAGYTVVIVRDDLLCRYSSKTPNCLLWKSYADSIPIQNVYNTPPTFIIYISRVILSQLEHDGGLINAERMAFRKANIVYNVIDKSEGFYYNSIQPCSRSRMNIPFRIKNPSLESIFLQDADKRGLFQLKGHPSAGGLRITSYNSITEESIERLTEFMIEFRNKYEKY